MGGWEGGDLFLVRKLDLLKLSIRVYLVVFNTFISFRYFFLIIEVVVNKVGRVYCVCVCSSCGMNIC